MDGVANLYDTVGVVLVPDTEDMKLVETMGLGAVKNGLGWDLEGSSKGSGGILSVLETLGA